MRSSESWCRNWIWRPASKLQAARAKMEEAMENAVFVDVSRAAARHKELQDETITGKAGGIMKSQSRICELVINLDVDEVLTSAANNSDYQLRSIHFADFKSALQDYEDQKDILALLKAEREEQLRSLILPRFLLLFSEEPRSLPLLNPSHAHQPLGALTGLILGGGLVFLAARKLALNAVT